MKTKMEFTVEGNDREEIESVALNVISEYLNVRLPEVTSLVDIEMIVKFGQKDLAFSAEVFVRIK